VINPFRDSIERRPQTSFYTRHPISTALIEEVFTPRPISLNEQLFIRLSLVRVTARNDQLPAALPELRGTVTSAARPEVR
jgi:hypothetical protein